MTAETDVAIIGAGVAGLSAAAALRRAGVRCEVLEAGARVGGRAWTDHPAELGGAPFDHGASWLHAAERNPLADLARAHGDALSSRGGDWVRHVRVGERRATEADLADYTHAWERFDTVARARAARAPDTDLADAVADLRGDPWTATVEAFESTLIAAADPRDLSVYDWHLNELTGSNLTVAGGVGALIARRLAPLAGPVRPRTPVSGVTWDQSGGVAVTTPSGTLSARACVVTVSTGVLAADHIAFDPPLPDPVRAAIEGLPMGLLSKVALHAATPDRFGLPRGASLHRQVASASEPAMFFHAWPNGQDYLVGFIGGVAARELSRAGPAAGVAFARDELRRLLGADAAAKFDGAVATDWGENPAFLGAYAYARPGHADARGALRQPFGPLLFAGEAWCDDGLAGTVGGAFRSGERAAAMALDVIGRGAVAGSQARNGARIDT
jgi:monoamine oxidase